MCRLDRCAQAHYPVVTCLEMQKVCIPDTKAHASMPICCCRIQVIERKKEIDWTRQGLFVAFGFAYLVRGAARSGSTRPWCPTRQELHSADASRGLCHCRPSALCVTFMCITIMCTLTHSCKPHSHTPLPCAHCTVLMYTLA